MLATAHLPAGLAALPTLRTARFIRTSADDAVALDEQGHPVAVLYRRAGGSWSLESDRLVLSGLRLNLA